MSTLGVDLGVLADMAARLSAGAEQLETAADSAPSSVDAGPMTPVISAMLAQITSSAGNVSTSMGAASEVVRTCRSYYQRADADAATSLSAIQREMGPRP